MENYNIRYKKARSHKTDYKTLKTLAKDKNYCIAEPALKTMTPEMRDNFVDEIVNKGDLLTYIARFEDTKPETLNKIVNFTKKFPEDDKWLTFHVFMAVASNKNTTPDTLAEVVKNTKYVESDFSKILEAVVENPNITPAIIDSILEITNDRWVVQAIAINDKTSSETLEKLVEYDDKYVRASIAYNLNTTSDILDKLLERTNEYWVVIAVAENKNTRPETLQKLIDNDKKSVSDGMDRICEVAKATLNEQLSRNKNSIANKKISHNDEER